MIDHASEASRIVDAVSGDNIITGGIVVPHAQYLSAQVHATLAVAAAIDRLTVWLQEGQP